MTVILGACGEVLPADPAPAPDSGAPVVEAGAVEDGAVDAGPVKCRWDAPFQQPVSLANLNGGYHDMAARPTADELTLYYARVVTAGGPLQIHRATRVSQAVPFGNPSVVSELATGTSRFFPTLSTDGRTIVFVQLGTTAELWSARRLEADGKFIDAGKLGQLSMGTSSAPLFTADGTSDDAELWFASDRGPDRRLRLYRVPWAAADSGDPTPVEHADAGVHATSPVLSSDRLTLYFASGATREATRIVVAHRESVDQAFGAATPIKELAGTTIGEIPDWISPDECRLYFTRLSSVAGVGHQVFVAGRTPL